MDNFWGLFRNQKEDEGRPSCCNLCCSKSGFPATWSHPPPPCVVPKNVKNICPWCGEIIFILLCIVCRSEWGTSFLPGCRLRSMQTLHCSGRSTHINSSSWISVFNICQNIVNFENIDDRVIFWWRNNLPKVDNVIWNKWMDNFWGLFRNQKEDEGRPFLLQFVLQQFRLSCDLVGRGCAHPPRENCDFQRNGTNIGGDFVQWIVLFGSEMYCVDAAVLLFRKWVLLGWYGIFMLEWNGMFMFWSLFKSVLLLKVGLFKPQKKEVWQFSKWAYSSLRRRVKVYYNFVL